jgi:hypothetical protein
MASSCSGCGKKTSFFSLSSTICWTCGSVQYLEIKRQNQENSERSQRLIDEATRSTLDLETFCPACDSGNILLCENPHLYFSKKFIKYFEAMNCLDCGKSWAVLKSRGLLFFWAIFLLCGIVASFFVGLASLLLAFVLHPLLIKGCLLAVLIGFSMCCAFFRICRVLSI